MRHRWIAAPVAVALLLAACGGDDASSTEPSAAPTVAATDPSSTEAVDDAYPVTIAHKYGETTIESRPERIVLVGLTEQDALLALGVTPVAVSEWFGGYDHGIWPWAQPFLGDAKPEVLAFGDAPPYERITALKPDLILGLYSGLYEEEYATLSAIAPTVAQPGEYSDFGIPWQEETLTIGRIVGERARAEQLVAEVEAKFAEVRAANPEFAGKTAVMATPYEGIWVYSPEDPRGRFLTSLGFECPPTSPTSSSPRT